MALIEHDLFRGRIDKVQIAIDRMKMFEPPEGYYLAYSGGKDSDTILALAKMAGVKFDAHYNLTTVDPPELVWHVKKHPEVMVERPLKTMWQLIREHHCPPTMVRRYCCEALKERGGTGRIVITGIRAQESVKRSKRQMVETCYKDPTKKYVHPIIDWTTSEVWEFLRGEEIDYCSLYDEGFHRLGCILCPFSSRHKQEMARWPKVAYRWEKSIKAVWQESLSAQEFRTADIYWRWWLSKKGKSEDGGLFT